MPLAIYTEYLSPSELLADTVGVAGDAATLPLCVDLDGTLVKSDTLHDSLLVLIQQKPSQLLRLPLWVLRGKAAFKRRVSDAVTLEAAHLPYNRPLLQYLRQQHASGRPLYLATASDSALAHSVAAHLGIFTGVLASDGATNLAAGSKLAALRARFPGGFSYIGNARPDASVLAAAAGPMVANPHRSLSAELRRTQIVPVQRFADRAALLPRLQRALRVHQWAKNTLIFLPMLLAHGRSLRSLQAALLAFFSFSFCASATYILNDLLDIAADRRNPVKCRRPFAAGDLSVPAGLGLIAALLAAAIALPLAMPPMPLVAGILYPGREGFYIWLAIYAVVTLSYSLRLKRMLVVDTIVLSGLYTLRILAGSAATGYAISPWLAAFSLFFFLSLAFIKRFSELENLRARGVAASNGRGYNVGDLEQLRSFGSSSAFAAVIIFALYINNPTVSALYSHPMRLWLLTPVLVLWLCRIWMLASRGQLNEDPVVYALTDRRSLLLGLLSAAILISAAALR